MVVVRPTLSGMIYATATSQADEAYDLATSPVTTDSAQYSSLSSSFEQFRITSLAAEWQCSLNSQNNSGTVKFFKVRADAMSTAFFPAAQSTYVQGEEWFPISQPLACVSHPVDQQSGNFNDISATGGTVFDNWDSLAFCFSAPDVSTDLGQLGLLTVVMKIEATPKTGNVVAGMSHSTPSPDMSLWSILNAFYDRTEQAFTSAAAVRSVGRAVVGLSGGLLGAVSLANVVARLRR